MAAPPRPWEGSDRPTPYTVVNTKDGAPTTILPLGGWKGRGLSISLSLFHSLNADADSPFWRYGWLNSYEMALHAFDDRTAGGIPTTWELEQPDGGRRLFTSTDGHTFTEEAGFFDKILVEVTDGITSPMSIGGATIGASITGKDGVSYVFTDLETGAEPHRGGPSLETMSKGSGHPFYPDSFYIRLRRIVDRNGNTITVKYVNPDGTGALSTVTDATGRSLTFTYPSQYQTIITDPSGQTWTLTTDTNSKLTSVVNAAPGMTSRTFSFGYSGANIASLSDWKTNAEHPGQTTWSYTYSGGKITQVDGPSTMSPPQRPQRKYTYGLNDGTDTLIETKTGNGTYSKTQHTYDSAQGNLILLWKEAASDSGGLEPQITLGYADSEDPHLATSVEKVFGQSYTVYYDANANPVSMSSQGGLTLVSHNDPADPNLATQIVDTQGRAMTAKYDGNGNLTDVWDANHPVADTGPDLAVLHTHYAVDTRGRVTGMSNYSVSGSMPKAWTYIYDDVNNYGNLTGIQRPGSSSPNQIFGYDILSRRVWSKLSPAESKTNYRYDGFGRLTGIDYGDNGVWDITYSYDANGSMVHMTDQTGIPTDWDRDALNRATAEYKSKGTGGQKAAYWTYNSDGSHASFTNWNSEVTNYAHFPNGQLETASGPWGAGNDVRFRYLCSCGQPDSMDTPGFHVEDRGDGVGGSHGHIYYERNLDPNHVYDSYSDPQMFWEKIHTPPAYYAVEDTRHVNMIESSGPDNVSRVQLFAPTHGVPNPDKMYRTTTDRMYYYDGSDYMTAGASVYNNLYQFDDVDADQQNPGNRTAATKDGASWTYQYDTTGLNRLGYVREAGTLVDDFLYDAAGNVLYAGRYDAPGYGQHTFSYTGANQLAGIADSGTYGSGSVKFVYDGLGRLAQKKDGTGSLFESYYYNGNNRTWQAEANGDSVSYQWAGGRLLSQKQTISGTTTTAWYILDVLGNVRALVDGQNNLLAQYIYDAFGNEQAGTFDNLSIPNTFRYRGSLGNSRVYGGYEGSSLQERGGYTLYNAGARTYHTGIGRWLQEDPIIGIPADPTSFNRFLYCNADPVNNSDPLGLSSQTNYGPDPPCYGAAPVCQAGIAGAGTIIQGFAAGLVACDYVSRPDGQSPAIGLAAGFSSIGGGLASVGAGTSALAAGAAADAVAGAAGLSAVAGIGAGIAVASGIGLVVIGVAAVVVASQHT